MKNTTIKHIIWIAASLIFTLVTTSSFTKEKKPKFATETFTVYGCCGDCKERIEDALDVKGIRFASWDKQTHALTVTHKLKTISLNQIHELIAAVGHDTDLVKASDSTYNNLPECCQYRGGHKCTH